MSLRAQVSYAGLQGIRALRFPFGRGVTPSACTIYCLPSSHVDPEGPLLMSYNGTTIQFPDMAVASAHVRQPHDGKWPIMTVTLLDRRWRWAGKIVSGDWNRRAADGTLDTVTRKTPAELATLLLNALGESGFDVSGMPSNVYPRCNWQNARADIALQKLCEYVACEVVLNPRTNGVEIWASGTGSNPPEGVGEVQPKRRHAPRAYVPNKVQVNCGHSLWQSRLLLQACCRDYPSGEQKSLSETNVRPANGWTYEHPNIFAGISDVNKRIRAFEDVYKTYRVIGQQNGTLPISPFPFPIGSPNQYVLNDYILDTETDLKGVKHNLAPYVEVGNAWGYTLTTTNHSGLARSFVPFKLHQDRQICEFDKATFALSSTGTFQEATLYLTTSYRIRTEQGQFAGLFRFDIVGGSGGDLILERPELFSVYNYTTQTHTEAQVIAEADAYVALFMRKYQVQTSAEITYPGLEFGSLDGNTAQATWEWYINDAPKTTVFEGDENDVTALSSRQKRRNLQLEAVA